MRARGTGAFSRTGSDADDFQRRVHAVSPDGEAETRGGTRQGVGRQGRKEARHHAARVLGGFVRMAASFLAINQVYGKDFFKVNEVEMFEKAAAAEGGVPRNVFVFDDQTHIVRSSVNSANGLRALAQGPGTVSAAGDWLSNPFNGT